jgi:hypothetical protein
VKRAIRHHARRLPTPGDDLEPDESRMHAGRRRKQPPAAPSLIEKPLAHFAKDAVSARVDAALEHFAKMRQAIDNPPHASPEKVTRRLQTDAGRNVLPPSDRD